MFPFAAWRCRFLLFTLALAIGVSAPAPVLGEEAAAVQAERARTESAEAKAKRAQLLTRSIMSPFCPGRTVDACSSGFARVWRDDIRNWVEAGVSSEDIRERLRQRKPDADLSGTPSTAMDGVLPLLLTALAVVLLVFIFRLLIKPRRAEETSPAVAKRSEQELDARLDEELAALDDANNV